MEPTQPKQIVIPSNIEDPKFMEAMDVVLFNAVEFNWVPESRELVKEFTRILGNHPELLQKNPKLYDYLKKLIIKFKFISLALATDEEIIEFISKNLLVAFEMPKYSLKRSINEYLVKFIDNLELYDKIEMITKAVNESLIKIGQNDLEIDSGSVTPTIAHWIGEYNKKYGLEKDRGTFEQRDFINNNVNARKLDTQNRELLRKVLNFYDWSLFPEETDEGREVLPPEIEKELKYIQQHAKEIIQEVIEAEKKADEAEKKEGIKIPQTPVPKPPVHGARLEDFKDRIEHEKVIDTKEIAREVATPELPKHVQSPPVIAPVKPLQPIPQKVVAPAVLQKPTPVPKTGLASLVDIRMVDDLKKIEVAHLRQGKLQDQTNLIKSKIAYLSAANRLLPYHLVQAFEASSLFKAYLSHGNAKFQGSKPSSDLSLAEFEAVADLRKEIERM